MIRLSDWSANSGTKCWNGSTRVGDDNETTGDETGTLYLDVVAYNGDYYKCVSNTTMGSTTPDNDTIGTGHHWELFSIANDQTMANLLVTNSAFINSLTSHQVVVTDNNNDVVGGITSGKAINTTLEGGNAFTKTQQNVGDVRI